MNQLVVKGFLQKEDPLFYDVQGDVFVASTYNGKCVVEGLFDSIQRQIASEPDVVSFSDRKRRLGHDISIINDAHIRIYYLDTEATLEEAVNCLACAFDGKYYTDKDLVGYSEYTITGYCVNSCRIGNHDLVAEVKSHVGEYIIFVLEW